MKKVGKITLLLLAMLVFCTIVQDASEAQLSREIREKFEGMLDELPVDLRKKFKQAIEMGNPVVEMTPDQFRRFRNHPINPFDIKDVDPDDLDGNIELKFELPSLRNRPIQPFERQSRGMRRKMRPRIAQASKSTVSVQGDGENVALGIIVAANGYVLTKASEIKGRDELVVLVGTQKSYDAQVVDLNSKNDLALLKINADGLVPVTWSNRQPRLGSFLLTPNHRNQVIALGSYSAVPRSIIGKNQAFLGVQPRTDSIGVRIDEVTRGSAADLAGLVEGDVITKLDGAKIQDVTELVNAIRRNSPGDTIKIEYARDGQTRTASAKLAGINLSGERAARFKMMSRLGAIPSQRAANFPVVFQHDSPLFPEQCGGPICDLKGNVIGVNIARDSRASSFGIPSNHVQVLVSEMMRQDVASREKSRR